MFHPKLLTVIPLCIVNLLNGQESIPAHTIRQHSYEQLEEKIEAAQDSITQREYTDAFLKKAKNEHNPERVFEGYKNKIYLQSSLSLKLAYCDSLIGAAKDLKSEFLCSGYITKGAVYYSDKNYRQALAAYLKANAGLSENTNPYLFHKSNYCIAEVKYYLGFYPDAITLLRQCTAFFQSDYPRAYLNSLHLLGLAYNKNQQFSACSATNRKGISESAKLGETEMTQYFLHSEGVNLYPRGEYRKAIQHLEGSLSFLRFKKDYANEAVACFYLGKCYIKVGNTSKAIPFLEHVYAIFKTNNYVRQDVLEAYTLLSDYYRQKGDLNKELQFTNALLRADSLLDNDYRELSLQLHRQYDTRELQRQKKALEQRLRNDSQNNTVLSLSLLAVTLIATGAALRQYRLRKSYLKKFTAIMQQPQHIEPRPEPREAVLTLKKEVAETLYKRLQKFEKNREYLNPEMNLNEMARLFNTNSKYITQIIHYHKGLKTNDYINSLRIHHITQELKHNRKYLNYSVKGITIDAGFKNVQSFRKAFMHHNNVPLSYFLEKLKTAQEAVEV